MPWKKSLAIICAIACFLFVSCGAPLDNSQNIQNSNDGNPTGGGGNSPGLAPAGSPLAWYKADSFSNVGDGALVSSWSDSSSNGYPANEFNSGLQPVYRASKINGLPAVSFDGLSARLDTQLALPQPGVLSAFAVVEMNTASGNIAANSILSFDGSTGGFYPELCAYTQLWTLSVGNGRFAPVSENVGTFVLVEAIYSSTDVLFLRNGVAYDRGAAPTFGPNFSNMTIGYDANNGGEQFWPGYIAEIIIYSTAISSTDRKTTESYLNGKYSLY
jgi:hypothetical protein